VEASRSIRTAETGAARTMIDRAMDRFGLYPERLIADTAYGSGPMLGWLVEEHGIEPQSIIKDVASPLIAMGELDYYGPGGIRLRVADGSDAEIPDDALSLNKLITELEKRMRSAAKALEFEEAARLRDRLRELRRQQIYKT